MTSRADILDAVVIGAGWAGLGVSHALTQRGLRHRVLERGRIGETWRTQRWDSFRINTPNIQTVMPGDTYVGPDPDGAMTSGEHDRCASLDLAGLITDYPSLVLQVQA